MNIQVVVWEGDFMYNFNLECVPCSFIERFGKWMESWCWRIDDKLKMESYERQERFN